MLSEKLIGIAAALGSAAAWAMGSVLFKMLGDKLPPVPLTFAKGLAGAAMLGIALTSFGLHSVAYPSLLLLMVSGLLGIAIGDTFFLWRCGTLARTRL
jgi:drug/metabolite transporter (DMT)-like permease